MNPLTQQYEQKAKNNDQTQVTTPINRVPQGQGYAI